MITISEECWSSGNSSILKSKLEAIADMCKHICIHTKEDPSRERMARFRSTFRISGSPGIQEYNMQVAD
jgi:hypothetical protein